MICEIHECKDRARYVVQYWRCPQAPHPWAYRAKVCGLHAKRWPVPFTLFINVISHVDTEPPL